MYITGAGEIARFASTGSVGIRTVTPTATLQVSGTFTVSSSARPTSPTLYVDSNGYLGIGTNALGTWASPYTVAKIGDNGFLVNYIAGSFGLYKNIYDDGTPKYWMDGTAAQLFVRPSGKFSFLTAPSGSAGAAATLTEWMTIANSGNVGISATAPSMKLEVVGQGDGPASTGTIQTGVMRPQGSSTNVLDFGLKTTSSPYGAWLQAADATNLATTYPLLLQPNGGYVGIGTSGPASKLDVFNSTNAVTDITVQNSQGIAKFGTDMSSTAHVWTTGA
jgi:hypothetical protein